MQKIKNYINNRNELYYKNEYDLSVICSTPSLDYKLRKEIMQYSLKFKKLEEEFKGEETRLSLLVNHHIKKYELQLKQKLALYLHKAHIRGCFDTDTFSSRPNNDSEDNFETNKQFVSKVIII